MAAPMENLPGELKVEPVESIPDELNLSSPNFNPLRVLYAENVHLPHKNPVTFNNLSEFENVVIRGNSRRGISCRGRGRGRIKRGSQRHSSITTADAETKIKDVDSSEIDQDKALLLARRKKMNRNVLTRMTNYDKGPLTVLKKAVEEQIRVKVWTRSAVTRRGYCLAYLIAFDKHFNLALMDVDETYRLPQVIRNPIQKETMEQCNTENEEVVDTVDREPQQGQPESSDKMSSEKLVSTDNIMPEKLVSTDNIMPEKLVSTDKISSEQLFCTDNITPEQLVSKDKITAEQFSTDKITPEQSSNRRGSYSEDDEGVTKMTERLSIKHQNELQSSVEHSGEHQNVTTQELIDTEQDKMTPPTQETNLTADNSNEPSQELTGDSSSHRKDNSKKRKDKNYMTEVQYKNYHRHVNQLFIRGDNVVSVVLLD